MMYDRTLENRLHVFEDITCDNHDTLYELMSAFMDLCKMLSQKEVITEDEFDHITNKRRYIPSTTNIPDVHAHWEEIAPGRGKLYFKCSNCSTTFVPSHGLVYKYCFYCGAKMDEVPSEY